MITKQQLIEMSKTKTIEEIAKEIGASYVTVWKTLKECGISKKRGRPKLIVD